MRRFVFCAVLVLASMPASIARAGVVNPDISVIGQPLLSWNDVAGDPIGIRRSPASREAPLLCPSLDQEGRCS